MTDRSGQNNDGGRAAEHHDAHRLGREAEGERGEAGVNEPALHLRSRRRVCSYMRLRVAVVCGATNLREGMLTVLAPAIVLVLVGRVAGAVFGGWCCDGWCDGCCGGCCGWCRGG